MANRLNTNPIHIDDFSAAIDLADYLAPEVHLDSIEWARPTTATHTAVIFSGGSSGVTIFDEYCVTAHQSIIKYFHGTPLKPPYIAATGVGSGKIIIVINR